MNIIILLVVVLEVTHCAYNKTQSIEYAYFSAIAHCEKDQIERWSGPNCAKIPSFQNATFIQNSVTKIRGFIGYNPQKNRIVASWRGTDGARNWAEDFNFQLIPYRCKDCFIHGGFYEAYKSVEVQVNTKIQSLRKVHPQAKIFVTGQSLGGALATICGLQLQLKYGIVQQIHNFGSPRIGNENMANFVNSKVNEVSRVVHHKDIVPHLPPTQVGAYKYHHVRFEVFFDQQMNNYIICDSSGEDKNCSNKYFPDYSFADHDFYFTTMDC